MIRKALEKDLLNVEKVYNELLDYQANNINYTNWKKGVYPCYHTGKKAFDEDTLYVLENDNIIEGSMILNHIQAEEYKNIPWKLEAEDNEVLVIHTLCIKPSSSRKKLGEQMVSFAEKKAKELGCKVIRLDTYEGNLPACKFYPKLGYTYSGSCEFYFQGFIREILNCYEKEIL